MKFNVVCPTGCTGTLLLSTGSQKAPLAIKPVKASKTTQLVTVKLPSYDLKTVKFARHRKKKVRAKLTLTDAAGQIVVAVALFK